MEIKKGYTLKMKNGREWTVDRFDGKYIYTKEGAQFAPSHPDIERIEEKKYYEKKQEDSNNTYHYKKKNK